MDLPTATNLCCKFGPDLQGISTADFANGKHSKLHLSGKSANIVGRRKHMLAINCGKIENPKTGGQVQMGPGVKTAHRPGQDPKDGGYKVRTKKDRRGR
jgi:hypothetical protein